MKKKKKPTVLEIKHTTAFKNVETQACAFKKNTGRQPNINLMSTWPFLTMSPRKDAASVPAPASDDAGAASGGLAAAAGVRGTLFEWHWRATYVTFWVARGGAGPLPYPLLGAFDRYA